MQRKITKDSGYAWVVLASVFSCHIFSYGMSWTTGIFYVEFLHALDYTSTSQVALAPALNTGIMYAIGPVAGFLINKFGCRTIGMLGGVMAGLGLALSALSTNVHYICFTFGAVTGIGLGLNFLAGMTMLSLYFDRYRAISIAVATSGIGVGVLFYPIMIRYLLVEFGWNGAILITAGMTFHLVACAVAFPPLDPEQTTAKVEPDPKKTPTGSVSSQEDICQSSKLDFLHLRLFRNFDYCILCVNGFLLCFGISVMYVHLAAYAESVDIIGQRGALLFSTIGVTNFVGRYILGAMTKLPRCESGAIIHLLGCSIAGLSTMALPISDHYIWMQFSCIIFGVSSATLGTMIPIVILDLLGPSAMANGYGNLMLFEAVGQVLGAPIASMVYDHSNEYPFSMFLGGCSMVASGLVMLIIIIRQCRQKKPIEDEYTLASLAPAGVHC